MLRSVGFASVLLVLVGCASSTETSGGARGADETTTSGLQLIESSPLAMSTPDEVAADKASADECQPGDERSCKQTYVDAEGTAHCLSATQFCSAEGNGWLPCGQVPTEEDAGTK